MSECTLGSCWVPDEVEWFSMCPFRNTQQSNKLSHSIAGKYGLGLTLEAEFIYLSMLLCCFFLSSWTCLILSTKPRVSRKNFSLFCLLCPVFAKWISYLPFADLALTLLLEYTSLRSGRTLFWLRWLCLLITLYILFFVRQIARLPALRRRLFSRQHSSRFCGSASLDLGNRRFLMGPL